jgi:transcription antitermination factor NusG
MDLKWYAIHSKPNKEAQLWDQLLSRGVDCYYPRLQVSPVNPRSRKIRPYFPGYLFIHVDLGVTGISSLNWMPFATGLVSFDSIPTAIPDGIVQSLHQNIGDVVNAIDNLFDDLKKGDKVVILEGPFKGFEAIFDTRLSGSERVGLLLRLINGQQVRLQISANTIQKPKPVKR